MRNASNTPSNTHFLTHYLWLVKIYMGSTKSCGSHINLVGPIWILTNQRECVEKCVLEDVLLAFLLKYIIFVEVEVVVVIAMMIHLFEFESTIYSKYMVASLLIMKSVSYMYTCLAVHYPRNVDCTWVW